MTDEMSPNASNDDHLRRQAAQHLADQLEMSCELLQRSQVLAAQTRGDRIKPLVAGARLIAANAQLARALGFLAQTESRNRSFIETIQPPAPKTAKLNSRFSKPEKTPLERAQVIEKFYRRLDEIIKDSIRHRSGDPSAPDIVARNLKMAQEGVARQTEILAENGDEDDGEGEKD